MDEPTIEEAVAAGLEAIREAVGFGKATALLDVTSLRTLLQSHASLEEWKKEAKMPMEPFMIDNGIEMLWPEEVSALAAFVNKKET